MSDPETLAVIFRADKCGPTAGEVTAVFPTLDAGNGLATCYAHIGQHGSCSLDWYRSRTRPATPEESADLLAELRGIYENGEDAVYLQPVLRWKGKN